MSIPFPIFADENRQEPPPADASAERPTTPVESSAEPAGTVAETPIAEPLTVSELPVDTASVVVVADSTAIAAGFDRRRAFSPDPNRALWLSALCPGLGQIYNRRYWKLPIVIGGYVGLAYATAWNNRMLTDYTKAYRDITDNDPSTKSYMDLYPSTTSEDDIDTAWLTRSLQSKKTFYRRNRDLCIICMVGLYLVCMVDAYVDASLSQFDISSDLSMSVGPAVISSDRNPFGALGVNCAFTF